MSSWIFGLSFSPRAILSSQYPGANQESLKCKPIQLWDGKYGLESWDLVKWSVYFVKVKCWALPVLDSVYVTVQSSGEGASTKVVCCSNRLVQEEAGEVRKPFSWLFHILWRLKVCSRDLIQNILTRKPKMSSFLEWRDMKIVYKRWGS